MTMNRRAVLSLPAAILGCRPSGKRSVRLGAVSVGAPFQLPVIAAQALGYFGEQGVSATVDDIASGARAMQALLGGSVDVISALFDQLVLMAAENRDVRSFLLMETLPLCILAASPKVRGRINQISDLKGATIGVTSPGHPCTSRSTTC